MHICDSNEVVETSPFYGQVSLYFFFTEYMEDLIADSAEHIMQFSGNRSLTQLTSQSDSTNIWPCVLGVGRGDWKVLFFYTPG